MFHPVAHRLPLPCLLLALLAACGDDAPTPGTPDSGPVPDAADDTQSDGTLPPDDVAPDGGDDPDAPETTPDLVDDPEEDAPVSAALRCDGSATLDLIPGVAAEVEVEVEGGAVPLVVSVDGNEASDPTVLLVGCSEGTIVPEGFIPLSPTYRIASDDLARFERRYFVLAPFERARMPDGAGPASVRLFWAPEEGPGREILVANVQENMARGTLRFEPDRAGRFQIAVAENAGQTYDREWQFRAITGISMGASGANMIGVRNHELFDIIAPLGGPTDWAYLAEYIRRGGMGGFEPAPTFGRAPLYTTTDEFEHPQAYDEWWFPAGEGTGGSFNRGDYIQIFHDLMLTFGNINSYSDISPYAAAGLPLEELLRPASERCAFTEGCGTNTGAFRIATGYYDDEYNPDGTFPVITFCDGQGSRDRTIPFDRACDLNFDGRPDETNEGLYDAPCDQRFPVNIAFAVDVNDNGLRDPGEPVIRNFYEPFDDWGSDGIPSVDEEGYDPVTNPDPAGDDYDWATNPFGTEGNWRWDEGEPWRDYGLDGVPGTPQLADGGYDFGEGNEVYDFNPNLERLLFELNPTHLLRSMTPAERDRVTFYLDAGIRDLFNFAVSTNHFMGAVHGLGGNVRMYDGFTAVQDLERDRARDYNFTEVDYANLGDNVYVRYGDLDADEEDICYGDGKHVGTVEQIANRLLTMLGFVTNRFPEGETTVVRSPYPLASGTYWFRSPSTGALVRYSISFPPGYEYTQCTDGVDNDADGWVDGLDPECTDATVMSESGESVDYCNDGVDNDNDGRIDGLDPECATGDGRSEYPDDFGLRGATFPVIFILHGYGQTPEDLKTSAVPFSSFMAQGRWPKAMLVFPDGYCGTTEVTQCNDRVDNDDDGLIDGGDPGCAASGGRNEAGTRIPYCADGIDNDRDGFIDMADGGCLTETWDSEADCLRGNFYVDHVAYPDGVPGGPLYERRFLDLIDHLDERYPTRAPETHPARR